MDCTGEIKREQICRVYDIEVVGCYKLFGGQSIVSDAGGNTITDKYYLFTCVHKGTKQEETIRCGQPTARHICGICGINIPSEFNPFREEHMGGDGGGGNRDGVLWHRSRRQLYNAIMLFITRYGAGLKPDSPIFKIKARVEADVTEPVEARDVLAVNTILGRYQTTMSKLLREFARTRDVRNFNFNMLEQILVERQIDNNNFR